MKILGLLKIKTLDLYIIKKFLGTFFFCILLIIVVTVVFDISEKIDNFIDKKAPLKAIAFDYYLNFVPYFISLFISLFIFISVIFFTAKMAGQSEIIAILSSGISFRRFLYPYFVGAVFLALFSFFISDLIMPSANARRLVFEDKYLKSQVNYHERNVHKQVEQGLFVYLETFSTGQETAYLFSLERYENDRLVSKLISDNATWDKEKEKWTINNYYIRDIDSLGHETLRSGDKLDTTINLHPNEFKRRADKFIETMNLSQLKEFIEEMKMQGADNIKIFQMERYRRIAFPFSTFILTLIGASLTTKKVRGGIGINVLIGIGISFLYILLMQFSTEFATKGNLPPMLAAWIPNICFGFVGLFLYRIAPK